MRLPHIRALAVVLRSPWIVVQVALAIGGGAAAAFYSRPVQVDALYRTGLSAVAFSVIGFVIGAASLWTLVARATGSALAGWAAFAVFAAHPDVLYLQATPMTESLLMGLCLLGVTLTWKWVVQQGARGTWAPGVVLALACLTRYEAWPIREARNGGATVFLTTHDMVTANELCDRVAFRGRLDHSNKSAEDVS